MESDTDMKRWTAKRKRQVVLDILKGKDTVEDVVRTGWYRKDEVKSMKAQCRARRGAGYRSGLYSRHRHPWQFLLLVLKSKERQREAHVTSRRPFLESPHSWRRRAYNPEYTLTSTQA